MDILRSFSHPDEVKALLTFSIKGCDSIKSKGLYEDMSDDRKLCYEFLRKTSRSFAAVIQALDGDLRHATCIFYLVLRALDTVEDDMTIPLEEKLPMLRNFYKYLQDPEWKYLRSQEKDKEVLEKFPVISAEFRKLNPLFQEVISDITKGMGEGMTVYIDRAPDSYKDWDEYCHYVAGLVGIGLSRLFSASKLESEVVGKDTHLSNSMGLFLQKTNIIRDYLEDVKDERYFWPKEAWGKHVKEQGGLLKETPETALATLNELITNALEHVPDVMLYMSRIENQSVFNFCAIPQVMAVATLERCFDNYKVFEGVVKIRKGEAVRMMMEATSMESIKAIFTHFLTQIKNKIRTDDPKSQETARVVERGLEVCKTDIQFVSSSRFWPIYVSAGMLLSAIAWQYLTGIGTVFDKLNS